MANDWSGLDYFNATFNDFWLREAAENLAVQGEQSAMMAQAWKNDTGSLAASITGYEALLGDPRSNEGDPRWKEARALGNRAFQGRARGWRNPPEHYEPASGEQVDLGESQFPVAVVSVWTQYPDGGKLKDIILFSQVDDALQSALSQMQEVAEIVVAHSLTDLNTRLK